MKAGVWRILEDVIVEVMACEVFHHFCLEFMADVCHDSAELLSHFECAPANRRLIPTRNRRQMASYPVETAWKSTRSHVVCLGKAQSSKSKLPFQTTYYHKGYYQGSLWRQVSNVDYVEYLMNKIICLSTENCQDPQT